MKPRHFTALAAILLHFKELGVYYVAEAVADYLASTNPRFDRARFMTECGYPTPQGHRLK